MGNAGKDKRRRLKRKMTKAKATKLELELLRLSKAAKPLFRSSASREERCKALGLEPDDPQPLYKAISERIREALTAAAPEGERTFLDLERHLRLRLLCDDLPIADLLELVEILREKGELPSITETALWQQVLGLTQTFRENMGHPLQLPYTELRVLADAIKRLRSDGYPIEVTDGKPDRERWLPKVSNDLDRLVSEFGGVNLAEALFRQLQPRFNPLFGRYVIAPVISAFSQGNERPLLPFGYLLNLAAKHASTPGTPDEASLERILRVSTDLAALFECQPYSWAHGIYNNHTSILRYLQETVTFDSLFTFPQGNPTHLKRRLLGLLAPLEDAGYILLSFGVPLEQLASIADAIVLFTRPGPCTISPAPLARHLGLDAEVVTSVLGKLSRGSMNQAFLTPLEAEKSELHLVPLLRVSSGFLMLDPAMASAALFEAVLGVCWREHGPKVDELVGDGLEDYVKQRLAAKGCQPACGRYRSPSTGPSECDAVVETDETILLFEMKKKRLTPKARGAKSLDLLTDLGSALLHAQCQSGQHEVALYRDGSLTLGARTIRRKGRPTERVALSLPHFGSFHSRNLTLQFLHLMMGIKLTTSAEIDDSKVLKQLGVFDEYSAKLLDLHGKATDAGVPEPAKYYNCWFLSLDIFDVLLDESLDGESLWNAMKSSRGIASASRDWFSDYAFMKGIRSESAPPTSNSASLPESRVTEPRELNPSSPSV